MEGHFLRCMYFLKYGGNLPVVYGKYIDDGVKVTQMSLDEMNQGLLKKEGGIRLTLH